MEAKQRALLAIHRGLPEFVGVHLAKTLEALDGQPRSPEVSNARRDGRQIVQLDNLAVTVDQSKLRRRELACYQFLAHQKQIING